MATSLRPMKYLYVAGLPRRDIHRVLRSALAWPGSSVGRGHVAEQEVEPSPCWAREPVRRAERVKGDQLGDRARAMTPRCGYLGG